MDHHACTLHSTNFLNIIKTTEHTTNIEEESLFYGCTSIWLESVLTGNNEENQFYSSLDAIAAHFHQNPKTTTFTNETIAFVKKIADQQQNHSQSIFSSTELEYKGIGALTVNLEQLEYYLIDIESLLQRQVDQPCVGFMFETPDNIIGLYYHLDKDIWLYFNTSKLYPEQGYHFELDADEVSRQLFRECLLTEDENLPIIITTISASYHADLISKLASIKPPVIPVSTSSSEDYSETEDSSETKGNLETENNFYQVIQAIETSGSQSSNLSYGCTSLWLEATISSAYKEEILYDAERYFYDSLNTIVDIMSQESEEIMLPAQTITFATNIAHRQENPAFTEKFIPSAKQGFLQSKAFHYENASVIAPNLNEFQEILSKMKDFFHIKGAQLDVGFMINSTEKTIGLYYYFDNVDNSSWIYFNANQIGLKEKHYIKCDSKKAAKLIFSHNFTSKESDLPLCITAVSTTDHADFIATLAHITNQLNSLENRSIIVKNKCFWLACRYGDIDFIRYYIKMSQYGTKNDINLITVDGLFQPLHVACLYGHFEVAKILLQYGACPNLPQEDITNAPLYAACDRGHYNIVALLLKYGAKTHLIEELFIACQVGHAKIVSLLLKQKLIKEHVNTLDLGAHTTCLGVACIFEHLDVIQILLENGATPSLHIADLKGRTPLSIAREKDNPEMVKILSQYLPKNDDFQELDTPTLLLVPQFKSIHRKAGLIKESEKNEVRSKIKFS